MIIPVIGERYGTRIITATSIDYDEGKERVTLMCDCGHESSTQFRWVLKGNGCKFCVRGSQRREVAFPIGYQHGSRTVTGYDRDPRFNCGIRVRCRCGHEATIESSNIRAGIGLACAKCAGADRKRWGSNRPRLRPLSARDATILKLLDGGMRQVDIAAEMGIQQSKVSRVKRAQRKRAQS